MFDLRIITTGGTFDKHYDAVKGELTFHESHLPKILQQARTTLSICLEGALAVDSLQMTEEERAAVVDHIGHSTEDRIVVIHGTDTMVKTATLAAENPKTKGKVVVFTGAMIPYALELKLIMLLQVEIQQIEYGKFTHRVKYIMFIKE